MRKPLHLFVLLALFLQLLGCHGLVDAECELTEALKAADLERIQQAVEAGANPDSAQPGKASALGMLTRQYGGSNADKRKEIEQAITYLLEQGADPDALHHGFTPLQLATGQQSEVIVSRLLTYGADASMETQAGLAPIWQAVYDNNHRIGLELLKAGANPNSLNAAGQTPLQYLRACGYQKTRLMLQLRYYGGK